MESTYSFDSPYLPQARRECSVQCKQASKACALILVFAPQLLQRRSVGGAWSERVRTACAAGGHRRAPPELMMRPLLRITSSPCFASLSLRTASTSMCSPVKAGVSHALVSCANVRSVRLAMRRAERVAHLQATAAQAVAASAR